MMSLTIYSKAKCSFSFYYILQYNYYYLLKWFVCYYSPALGNIFKNPEVNTYFINTFYEVLKPLH